MRHWIIAVNIVKRLLSLFVTKRRINLVLKHKRQVALNHLDLLRCERFGFAMNLKITLQPIREISCCHFISLRAKKRRALRHNDKFSRAR
jgi:hypothetical protein